jgi:hypothetical protein
MQALLILSSLGGATAFFVLIGVIIRGVFKIVNSTEDNTKALTRLNATITDMNSKIISLDTRTTVLEDWRHSGHP